MYFRNKVQKMRLYQMTQRRVLPQPTLTIFVSKSVVLQCLFSRFLQFRQTWLFCFVGPRQQKQHEECRGKYFGSSFDAVSHSQRFIVCRVAFCGRADHTQIPLCKKYVFLRVNVLMGFLLEICLLIYFLNFL